MIINVKGGSFNFVSGNSTVVINDCKVDGNGCKKMKDIEDKKVVNAENIQKIKVDTCSADLNVICVSGTSEIKAVLSGSVNEDSNIKLNVKEKDGKISIGIDFDKVNRVTELKLYVFIPKKEYESISLNSGAGKVSLSGDFYSDKIKLNSSSGEISILGIIYTNILNIYSASGKIKVDKDVTAKKIYVECSNGNVDLRATFSKCSVDCTNGKINICIKASEDIEIRTNTIAGSIKICLENIGNLDSITEVMRGNVKNTFNKTGKFHALVKASTVYGNIEIK